MSKLYDNLKKTDQAKIQKGSQPSNKEIAQDITKVGSSGEGRVLSTPVFNKQLLVTFVLIVFFLVNLGLNITTFMMLRNTFLDRTNTLEARLIKTEKIGSQLDLLIIGIKGLKDDLVELSSKIKEQNEQIVNLVNNLDAHEVALDNLRKAKDTIFKRLSSLEASLPVNE